MKNKVKLFETVLGIHAKGAAHLSASERSTIETETQELLRGAGHKLAAKAPEGFDKLLSELTSAENADDAYEMVVGFLKSQDGIDGGDPKEDAPMDKPKEDLMDSPMGDPKEDAPMGAPMDKPKDKPMGDEKSDDKPKDKMEDKPSDEKPSDEKPEDKPKDKMEDKPKDKSIGDKGKGDKGKGDKLMDLEKEKKDILARARAAGDEVKEDMAKLKEDKDKPKDKDKDKEDAPISSESMGIKDPKTANKVTVKVTSSRNLLVSFDGKPLFHAIPNVETKASVSSLKRLANKVYGWVVYEGAVAAATKCGAKILAGADDDISVPFDADLGPETSPVTEDADDVLADSQETPAKSITDDAEFVSDETYDKVNAAVTDDADDVVSEAVETPSSDVTDGHEDVLDEELETPANDTQSDAEVDFKSAEASYKQLYASRAKKESIDLNKAFVTKFIRAIKVAATRMSLNHDDNPYKAASIDVLTSDNVSFSDGSVLEGLDESAASELTELIASEGHEPFITQLLTRTSSLMKKSDEYLEDLESDLGDLNVTPVEVAPAKSGTKRRSSKSEKVRKAASDGNFALTNNRARVTRTQNENNVGGLRAVIGDTPLSKLSKVLAGSR